MIHNPDNRFCDSGWEWKEVMFKRSDFAVLSSIQIMGFQAIMDQNLVRILNVYRRGGKSGVSNKKCQIPSGKFCKVNHYIGNMTKHVQHFW